MEDIETIFLQRFSVFVNVLEILLPQDTSKEIERVKTKLKKKTFIVIFETKERMWSRPFLSRNVRNHLLL